MEFKTSDLYALRLGKLRPKGAVCFGAAAAMLTVSYVGPVFAETESDSANVVTMSTATSASVSGIPAMNIQVETGLEPQKAEPEFRPYYLYRPLGIFELD